MKKSALILMGASVLAWAQTSFASAPFVSTASSAPDCVDGHAAFQKTVHPLVMQKCAGCHHKDSRQAPAFALMDSEKSYYYMLNVLDRNNVDRSVLVRRAGNDHCDEEENCGEAVGEEMKKLANQWWEMGEKSCQRSGKFFSQEISLPSALPEERDKFTTLRWDLTPISRYLDGYFLEMEAQQFMKRNESQPGAYRFRKPRLVFKDPMQKPAASFRFQGLKVLVNRKYDVIAGTYDTIDTVMSPEQNTKNKSWHFPVMSPHTLIVLQDQDRDDKFTISFEGFERLRVADCQAYDEFEKSVFSSIQKLDCMSCHAANEAAMNRFTMSGDKRELCRAASQRLGSESVFATALVKYPMRGLFGHPVNYYEKPPLPEEFREFIQGVEVWNAAERAAGGGSLDNGIDSSEFDWWLLGVPVAP